MELIQRGNRTFRVVPEARKVIGKKTTKTNPYVELMRIAKKTDDGLIFNLLWDYFCEKEVTSEAVCDPRDEWDWTKGIDIANAKLPDSYKNLEGVHLTKEDRQNATYKEEPNILKNTAIGSPISFLYSKFNKHEKTKRLFYEMQGYGDEVQLVPLKYNREIVSQITGLSGKDLMEFMVFCRFSYYDLVRWDSSEIIAAIRYKFSEYQYYKALEEEE